MSTQIVSQLVQWQDLKVKSEFDIVFEIAKIEGWKDCEIFGHGDMITQPEESKGWDLIPADQYKYSIPMEAVLRLHQIINAGIRVQGVIIADDQRRTPPTPAPAKPKVSLPSLKPIVSWIRNALLGFVRSVRGVASFSGKVLLGIVRAVGVMLLVGLGVAMLVYAWPVFLVGLVVLAGATGSSSSYESYDPKLIVLVDDGNGEPVWVSLFTWYD